ncbi:His/Glu/Gln/Arg/opine amino acid ABC transporter permease [Roseibium sp. TrichSKD4]|uniref:ABC transporter permease n=1 Tax=Roseibium sp. TrichSKD4 TaxID=744980 RepID=UPI0001E57019|nr:ABC transporter permease [Roseibium sp. TrichSKD4]EFO30440.1 His/Glu/Gln/Arg/opine amino acid ABC transporter permease [Roseibium sp. TrichSKD4]
MIAANPATGTPRPPAPPKPWTNARIAGHVLMALWAIAGLYLVYYLIGNLEKPILEFLLPYLPIDWQEYANERLALQTFDSYLERYGQKYIDGLIVTLQIVGLSLLFGAALSIPIAAARSSKWKIFSWPAYGFVYFFRGTPLIAQTFLIYYGFGSFRPELQSIGLWWFFRDAFYCVVFAFTLNTAAYQAEILRGAVQNVARGQWEGAAALGLSKPVTFFKIILPQALIVALRPYGNEIILMIKGSAIAAIVTVFDMFAETKRAYSRTYDFQAYIWAAVLYLMIVETLRRIWDKLEARLTRHLKR